MLGYDHDEGPRRGIRAQVQQPPNLDQHHATLLDLDVNQSVTVVTPPILVGHTIDMVSGEYMVGAATYFDDPLQPRNNEGVCSLA